MHKSTSVFLLLGAALLGVALSTALVSNEPADADPVRPERPPRADGTPARVLMVGTVSAAIREDTELWQPFATLLGQRLSGAGIDAGGVRMARTIEEAADLFVHGRIDVYIDSPFPALAVCERSGGRPILRRWKHGSARYHSVVFVRADADIHAPADLVGRVLAFETRSSTSGYLLPKSTLLDAGLELEPVEDAAAPVPAGHAGYVFSESDENTTYWVLEGKVAAGAMSLENLERRAQGRMGELRVLATSIEVPRHVVCVRPGLDAATVTAIERALLDLDQDEAGRRALAAFEGTTRFDRLTPGGLEPVRHVMRLLGREGAGD